jgi:hypothetical protein
MKADFLTKLRKRGAVKYYITECSNQNEFFEKVMDELPEI